MTPPPIVAKLANDHRLGRVHHVAIVVKDVDTALGFYRDILGLTVELILPGRKIRRAPQPIRVIGTELQEVTVG